MAMGDILVPAACMLTATVGGLFSDTTIQEYSDFLYKNVWYILAVFGSPLIPMRWMKNRKLINLIYHYFVSVLISAILGRWIIAARDVGEEGGVVVYLMIGVFLLPFFKAFYTMAETFGEKPKEGSSTIATVFKNLAAAIKAGISVFNSPTNTNTDEHTNEQEHEQEDSETPK